MPVDANFERFTDLVANLILKYADQVLPEIEKEEAKKFEGEHYEQIKRANL